MALNIINRAARDTDSFQLRDGNDELMFDGETPVKVTVYGPGSKQWQQAQAKANTRGIERLRKKGKVEITAEEQTRQNAEHLAAITHSFEGLEYGDEGLTGRDLALAIYSNPQLGYIGDQVTRHANDWANFTKPSSTT
jgi:hypothetical protein